MFLKICALVLISLIFISATAVDHDLSSKTGVLLIGDTGKNNDGQRRVSLSMLDLCAREKCDYGMLAGDNIYPGGMESENDPVIEAVFDNYYNALNIPFLISLGNHDYGELSFKWIRGKWQLGHAKKNPLFHLPHYYYIKELEHAVVAVIDTTRMMWKKDIRVQEELVAKAFEQAKAANKWFLVLGHHPYLSNGKHGNAGRYEGVPFPHFISGSTVKRFIKRHVCNKAHFYLSGHDHSLQVFDPDLKDCNTHLVVSGSGASATKLYPRNMVRFESLELGFFHLGIGSDTMSVRAYNDKTELLFEQNYFRF